LKLEEQQPAHCFSLPLQPIKKELMRKNVLNILFVLALAIFGSVSQVLAQPGDLKDTTYLESPDITPTCRQIIGYYPSWQWYDRGGLMHPERLDYTRYTILQYAFYQCDTMGNVYGTDEWADSVLLRGRFDWSSAVQPAYIPNTSLVDYAHVWGVKVCLSIGGWTLSENFPKVAADPARRAHFASECVRMCRTFQFDGIDIDWEYPGYADHKGTPADKENYTLFMKAIRDSLDAYGKEIKYKFLLTAAFGANLSQMQFIEYEKLVPIMDYFNMMTYDFNGSWSEDANHNSPLYSPAKGYQGSVDECVKLLTTKFGVPPEKILIGAGFYGRSLLFKDKPADLYATGHTGRVDDKIFRDDEGQPQYYNIALKQEKFFNEFWDDTAKVPYMISKDGKTFLSYDNARSIRLKAEYLVEKELGGVIIWEVTGDYIEKTPGSGRLEGTPLSDELVNVMKPCRRKTIRRRWRS
jgi:chitinase